MAEMKFDINFNSLSYFVSGWHKGVKKSKKEILKCVSGEFRSGELTAIVGQSGSGKTTLLDILSGFSTKNVSGMVTINGSTDIQMMRDRSTYIMQNDTHYHFITVREAMSFAMNVKERDMNNSCKNVKITSILENMGLADRLDCYCGNLSGGERRRLSIALELVDDPVILYLDEPISGLDSFSSTKCVKLLKKLAKEGKTIVCTIHTPSALLFAMFDHVYALADGYCIYQGTSEKLEPFLSKLDLVCPETYNPCDFLLEIANNDYGPQNYRLTEEMQNGSISVGRSAKTKLFICNPSSVIKRNSNSCYYRQLQQLLIRNAMIKKRDKTLSFMRLIAHLLIALFISVLYSEIGNDASHIIDIYRFLFFNVFILMFMAFSSLQTSFPLDLPIVKREHFNGWYSSGSYYFALIIVDAPLIILTSLIYIVITYFMTHQPMELFRFGAYYIIMLTFSFASQGLGLIAGSMLNVKYTLILGSILVFPFLMFSNFFVQMKDTHAGWHWAYEFSFTRLAFEGSVQAIFGYDRPKMNCEAIYCHFKIPKKFLQYLEVTDNVIPIIIMKLVIFILVFHVITFVIVWYRLKR